MFGDPIKNPKEWSRAPLEDLGDVVTGSTPPSAQQGMFGGAIPFVTPGDLERDTLKTARFVTDAGAEQSRLVRKGSTLVCCIGATIGKTDRAQAACAFNQQINAVEWKANVDDNYGLQVMKFFSNEVAARGRSTTLPILKKSAFEEIALPVPPFALQQKFAAIVPRFERVRAQQREAERQAEHLFQTLLHRAFNAEV
jgi:type I restriction enzyme, S subunit